MPESEQHGIAIDMATGEIEIFPLSDRPKDHRLGMFVSHRTGNKEQMETLRHSLINNNFKILKKVK